MKLKKILKGISHCVVKGSQEIVITGMSSNSKVIAPGNLFIAKRGRTYDGADYINEAIQAGASAIVTDLFDPRLKQVVQIIHPQVSLIESALVANYYQHPSHKMLMAGITGTNGKTTTAFIIKCLFDHFFGPCGLMGTIEYIVGKNRYQATHTTPDVTTNHKMLREMVDYGCRSAVMEVTSHALDQSRVDRIEFDIAIFSNLSLDHLDYHVTMENYAAAKKKFFDQLGKGVSEKSVAKWAIVNVDSKWSSYMVEGCSANILTYGIEKIADLQATQLSLESHGTYAKISYQGETLDFFWPLVGKFNVYNCLASIAAALTQKIPFQAIVQLLTEIPLIPGRLQPVPNVLGLKIYVDFSHKVDALLKVLETLREVRISTGRLIVVFGCGGDRDRSKRPKMAEVCEQYSDFCIVTSDNPRSEDPQKICSEIIVGFTPSAQYQVELDRRTAIKMAIEAANQDDLILIAGRGHERYQIFAHHKIEFNDSQVAAEICEQLTHTT